MSKRPKKRTKKYSGEDAKHLQASSSGPVVHQYTAVERSAIGQWWFEKKKFIKITAMTVGVVLLIGWMIYELVMLLT